MARTISSSSAMQTNPATFMFVSLRMGGGDAMVPVPSVAKSIGSNSCRPPETRIVEAEGFSQRLAAAMLN
jgi:hypothetical protein